MSFLMVVCLIGGMMSYLSVDPMKSSFFLILSMLACMPMMAFSGYVWFSYFVCMLFLSGVFVILVYFSSLSKISLVSSYMAYFSVVLSLVLVGLVFNLSLLGFVGLNVFYYSVYWPLLIYVLFVLLFFMNFTSYFLKFSGALRKV
uniref:NADH dehydrogenase subunit 6 n=1 Tax=Syngamus trachea TaxID=70241 RepID=D3J882_SYNTR|nr:NADH dehydrogenase subunit 6 [Syngamus trachea]ACX85181.1 NADH dehydrogenase subunit 6 [Syngamus trachea]